MAETGVETKLDTSVLNAEQQEKLRQFKIKTRIDNEKYIRAHPEVEVLIGDFLREILLKRPADIREFAGDYFSRLNPSGDSREEGNSDAE
ncbi:RIIa domain-containing protein 1 [Oryzias latipes]|uniref:RIIa domain-containing protein n=1 Tax=Oryzias latipes TaxID=8090 RepID=A0A3B3IEN2_ORYLA|nr:RIIa domain-containing protein 1 [Oryzias latipes]